MARTINPKRWRPLGFVLVLFAGLSLIFGLALEVVTASDASSIASHGFFLIIGALAYATAVFVLRHNRIASLRELAKFGDIDPLSRLPGRGTLQSHIERKSLTGEEIAVAIIDLDGFKQINGRYGHLVGDQLIGQVGMLLKETFGTEAKCYRLGGDEFAVMRHGMTAGTILEGLCRTFLTRLQSPIEIDTRSVTISASIGLVRSDEPERATASQLLRRADMALDASKRAGKMRCHWYSDALEESRHSIRQIEDALRKSLQNEELHLVYQPVVHAEKGQIVAVEALLRWNRKNGKPIGPNIFIPVAEETGLIYPIGLWVLKEAMSTAKRWEGIALSVNISAAQLRNPEFPIKLGEILEETGFPPEMLQLEVTETSLVLDPVVADRSLGLIRKFGVRIALDDFGTGYASIGFLRQFRFEKLKLDRSLVVEAEADEGSRAMMVTSVVLARALDMEVTAEGVETVEQADLARLAGCDQIQGWLYHKAMSAEEVDALLAKPHPQLAASLTL